MAWTETAVPPNPWVSTAGVPPSTWTPTPPCGTTVLVTTQQKTQTLYYVANSGQTLFSLGAADMFGNNVLLTDDTALIVSKGGLRLVPDDGTGAGGWGRATGRTCWGGERRASREGSRAAPRRLARGARGRRDGAARGGHAAHRR